MSTGSARVKKWRHDTKERIVEAMGGCCVCCGYDTCREALALHHLSDKDFSLGSIRANPASWETIVSELRKCVLVCVRCHAEIHARKRVVPLDAVRFDEQYAVYRKKQTEPCPICGEPKETWKITCSRGCAAKRARHIDWDAVDLLAECEKKSFCQVARELGVSDMSVRKRHKKLLLP